MGAEQGWAALARDLGQVLAAHPRKLKALALYIAVAVTLWLVFGLAIPAAGHNAKVAQCKQNLHAVQLAIERFSVDRNGDYPLDVHDVIKFGYIEQFPQNPFCGEPMRAVPVGIRPDRGDFNYIPILDAMGRATGYDLYMTF